MSPMVLKFQAPWEDWLRRDQKAALEWLKEYGEYRDIRVLEDGTIAATHELMYTRAICLGVTPDCHWETRFCFEDRTLATQRFHELRTEDDEPEGYTARRPQKNPE